MQLPHDITASPPGLLPPIIILSAEGPSEPLNSKGLIWILWRKISTNTKTKANLPCRNITEMKGLARKMIDQLD